MDVHIDIGTHDKNPSSKKHKEKHTNCVTCIKIYKNLQKSKGFEITQLG